MYKTNEDYATAMSELLFQMRIEENIPYGNECEYVPTEFAEKIIDDPKHIVLIKKRIYENVLADVNLSPQKFTNKYGKLGYTIDTYDHAFSVDAYVDEAWTEQQEALEALEEDQRQARLKVRYKVWVEVERIETDEQEDTEDYFDEECPVGISYCTTLEEAVELQKEIEKTFGDI